MAVSPDQKQKAKLRRLVRERNTVRAEMVELGEKDKDLGRKIMEMLEELGIRQTTEVAPNLDGYRLDRPERMVVNEEKLALWMRDHAPEEVYEATFQRKFVRKAFDEAVQAGDISGIDDILADDEYVTFKQDSPRLMPTKAVKG